MNSTSNTETATQTSSSTTGTAVAMSSSSLSKTFTEHFEDRKSLAAAYLLTVGAKALFCVEREVKPQESKESFKEEATIHTSIKVDELTATFLSKISSKQGIRARKRGRNGISRKINIHFETNNANLEYVPETKSFYSNSCSLVYKSFWNMTKTFDLENISILILTTTSGDKQNNNNSNNNARHLSLKTVGISNGALTSHGDGSNTNHKGIMSVDDNKIVTKEEFNSKTKRKVQIQQMPYIRITNADRYIDLQFETWADHRGCLESLQKFCQTMVAQRAGGIGIDYSSQVV